MPAKRKKIPKLEKDFFGQPSINRRIKEVCLKHGCEYRPVYPLETDSSDVGERAKLVTNGDLEAITMILLFADRPITASSFAEFRSFDTHLGVLDSDGFTITLQLVLRYDLTIKLMGILRKKSYSVPYVNFVVSKSEIKCIPTESSGKKLHSYFGEKEIIESAGMLKDRFFQEVDTTPTDNDSMDNVSMVDAFQKWLLAGMFKGFVEYFDDNVLEPKDILEKGFEELFDNEPPSEFFEPDLTHWSSDLIKRTKEKE